MTFSILCKYIISFNLLLRLSEFSICSYKCWSASQRCLISSRGLIRGKRRSSSLRTSKITSKFDSLSLECWKVGRLRLRRLLLLLLGLSLLCWIASNECWQLITWSRTINRHKFYSWLVSYVYIPGFCEKLLKGNFYSNALALPEPIINLSNRP